VGFIVYDIETSGREQRFDQILQFAAVHADDTLTETAALDLRCRRLPHVIPSPGALLVNRIRPEDLDRAPLSHLDLVRAMLDWVRPRLPAVFLGHNILRFDEHFLRHALYRTLHPVYLTNTNGNVRADTLRIAHAVQAVAPGAITVPTTDEGKPTFALEPLLRANGIDSDPDAAHDALADVRGTLALARLLKERASAVWDRMIANAAKGRVQAFLRERAGYVLVETIGSTVGARVVAPCGMVPGRDSTALVFDLAADPAPYQAMEAADLAAAVAAGRPFVRVRLNKQPGLFRIDEAPHVAAANGVPFEELKRRGTAIVRDEAFHARIGAALATSATPSVPSDRVEDQIYEGFPSRADERQRDVFHTLPWAERHAHCAALEDDRLAELAVRLIHAERPDLLPRDVRADLDRTWAERLLSPDPTVPWTTIAKARSEMANLRPEHPEKENWFVGYAIWLDQLTELLAEAVPLPHRTLISALSQVRGIGQSN
jgi:exodeoxyribonuclease-1